MQLKKFPDITVSTREEHRGFYHKTRKAQFFPPHLEMKVHFPTSSGKKSRHSCHTSRVVGLNLKVERNSRGCVPFQKTLMSQYTPHTLDSSALTGLSSRVLTHNMLARVTALWHLERSHRSLCQLDRKLDNTVTAREESGLACLHTRQGLSPLLKLHRMPEIHVSTGEEA